MKKFFLICLFFISGTLVCADADKAQRCNGTGGYERQEEVAVGEWDRVTMERFRCNTCGSLIPVDTEQNGTPIIFSEYHKEGLLAFITRKK